MKNLEPRTARTARTEMGNCGLGFRGSEVEEVAVSEGRRQWLRFLGGMGFLVLWGLFWGFVLFGWLDGGVR